MKVNVRIPLPDHTAAFAYRASVRVTNESAVASSVETGVGARVRRVKVAVTASLMQNSK